MTDVEVQDGKREYPTFVFCPRNPFVKEISANLTKEEMETSFNPNFNVDYKGILINDYEYIEKTEFEKSQLISLYHGRCDVFKIKHPSLVRENIVFHWTLGEDALFYAFQPGDEYVISKFIFTSVDTMRGQGIIRVVVLVVVATFF